MATAAESSGVSGALSRRIFGEAEREPQTGEQVAEPNRAGQRDGEARVNAAGSPELANSTPTQGISPGESRRLGNGSSPSGSGMLSHPVEISPSNTGTPFSSAASSPTGFRTPQQHSPGRDLAPLSLQDALDSPPDPSPATSQPQGERGGIEIGRGVTPVRTRLDSPMMSASPTTNIVDQLMGEVVRGRLSKDSENSSRRELNLSEENESVTTERGEPSGSLRSSADLDQRNRQPVPRPPGSSVGSGVLEPSATVPPNRQVDSGQQAAGNAISADSPHSVGAYSSSVAVKPTAGEPADLDNILKFKGEVQQPAVAAAPEATIKSEAAELIAAGPAAGTPAKEDFLGRINGSPGELGEVRPQAARQSTPADLLEGTVDTSAQQGRDEREPLESVKREVIQAAAAPAIASIHDDVPSSAAAVPSQQHNGQPGVYHTTTSQSYSSKKESSYESTSFVTTTRPASLGGPQTGNVLPSPALQQPSEALQPGAHTGPQGGLLAGQPLPNQAQQEIQSEEPQTQAAHQQAAPVPPDVGSSQEAQRKGGFLCCFG